MDCFDNKASIFGKKLESLFGKKGFEVFREK
jgi:hypothetical protein